MGEHPRVSAAVKAAILALVARARERTGWGLRRILRGLGLPRGRYHAWQRRAARGALSDRFPRPGPHREALLDEERGAVIAYALAHPKDGYRRLAWQMVDADVAYVSPSSVYRVLQEADLLYRWKRSQALGERPAAPRGPHERWHTDLMYLRIADTWYFLVTVLDAYSRYVVHWELLTSMTAADVTLVVQQAVEATGQQPQLVSDNGSQFTGKDFRDLVRRFSLEHIRIRTYHPESNGVLERFHRSTREALEDQDLRNLSQARAIIGVWVGYYNETRLHAALGYLPPAEYYHGDPTARQTARRQKLAHGRVVRRQQNQARRPAAA